MEVRPGADTNPKQQERYERSISGIATNGAIGRYERGSWPYYQEQERYQ